MNQDINILMILYNEEEIIKREKWKRIFNEDIFFPNINFLL